MNHRLFEQIIFDYMNYIIFILIFILIIVSNININYCLLYKALHN